MRDFPEYVHYYAIKKYRYPGTPSTNDTNRNLLLFRDPTVDGLKTGHTDAAGYCMIATAKRDFPNLGGGRRLLSIVLGASSENARANESQKLLNWGYTAYEAVRLFDANQAGRHAAGLEGQGRHASSWAAPSRSWWRCRPARPAKIKTQVARPDPLVAPFSQGPAGRHAQGHAGRPAGGRGAAGGAGGGRAGRRAGPRLGRDPALDQVAMPARMPG